MTNFNYNKILHEIIASKQSHKILNGMLVAAESFKTNDNKRLDCGVVFYGEYKIIIPSTDMNISRNDKKVIRSMIGAEIDFIVKEFDEDNKIAVASRKEAMELRKSIELIKHKIGEKVQVRVTGIGKNNCIVDCYGLESSVPINEIDYGYIDDISKCVQIGDKPLGVIKEMDIENNIIKISLKEAKEDPYDFLIKSLNRGGEYLGIVTGIQDYGIFLTLRKGINCLCPFPNWTNFSPVIGGKFVVKIKKIDYEKRKINANLMRTVN